ASLARRRLPGVELEAALDEDRRAAPRLVGEELARAAPGLDLDRVRLADLLVPLLREVVARDAHGGARDRLPRVRLAHLRIAGQRSEEVDLVQVHGSLQTDAVRPRRPCPTRR